ncbi:nitrate reductase assembly molybdenum cofactor insertion protein NarJ [Bradyrhizobium sp. JR6.1]
MRTFKVLSALLSYPTEALIDAAPEFLAVLDSDKLVPEACRKAVDLLIEEIALWRGL